MVTTLASVDSREVVRCEDCHLVQFRTNSNCCRKCRKPYNDPALPLAAQEIYVTPPPPPKPPKLAQRSKKSKDYVVRSGVAKNIRLLRKKSKLSQRQLAEALGIDRTYITKIERGKKLPTLALLEDLAAALNVPLVKIVCKSADSASEDEIAELLSNELLAEIIPYVRQLSPEQRQALLEQMLTLTTQAKPSFEV
jgi:transcriptional regulator with XRE-family HTH domain